jgi:hypothetical protein
VPRVGLYCTCPLHRCYTEHDNSTLNRVLDETLIAIKYITLGSFPVDLIDVVLLHLKVILM